MLEINHEALVRRAQNGDINAIGQLYDQHHERIFRYVWSRLRDKSLSEDVTGEIFVRMVSKLDTYQPASVPFQAWLYRIAQNLIIDHYRRQNGRVSVPLEHAEGLSETMNDPDAILEHKVTLEQVQYLLDRLDEAQREVVILRFLVGLPLQEVAVTLDKTVAAVKSLQHRGLLALRVALQQE